MATAWQILALLCQMLLGSGRSVTRRQPPRAVIGAVVIDPGSDRCGGDRCGGDRCGGDRCGTTGRRRGTGMVTLHDVAREADVAVSTVSRALSNPDRVSRSTRDHVLLVARKLGY